MEPCEEARNDLMQRLQSSMATSSSSLPKLDQQPSPQSQQQTQALPPSGQQPSGNRFDLLHAYRSSSPLHHFSGNLPVSSPSIQIGGKRPSGIPPTSPYSQTPASVSSSRSPTQQSGLHTFGQSPFHARSLSQPASLFSSDLLPPLSPSQYRDSPSPTVTNDPMSTDLHTENRDFKCQSTTPPSGPLPRSNPGRPSDNLPPRKSHRRSHSDIPFGFSQAAFSAFPPLMQRPQGFLDRSLSLTDNPGSAGKQLEHQLVKQESDWDRDLDSSADGTTERKSEEDGGDDLFSAFMNLDTFDALNSSGTEDKREELDSRESENEAESGVRLLPKKVKASPSSEQQGSKRSATDNLEVNASAPRHSRSMSMDSFMEKMNFGDESPKLPPCPGIRQGQHSRTNSLDGSSSNFSLDLAAGEFSGSELKKIMANEKLAEIALTDPKRAKRILANRQSAARSKERKLRYISELEHKVQVLQTEATTLSAQLTMLQRDSAGLTNQNSELKFRLQSMEQQARLRDALNEALTAEVQRLKLATGELSDGNASANLSQRIFQLNQQHQQSTQQPIYQLSSQQRQQDQTHQSQQESSTITSEAPKKVNA